MQGHLNWKKYWDVRFENPLDDAESLEIDKQGYIQNIGQKVDNLEKIQGQYIGLMKFQNKGCDMVKKFYMRGVITFYILIFLKTKTGNT